MKKALTKIAATLSAALLGALPMANSLSASAASPSGVKTYRTYLYYSGGATQTRRVDVEFYTNNPLKVKGNARTTGCLNGWMDREEKGGNSYGERFYKSWKTQNITTGVGTLFKVVSEIKSGNSTYNDLAGAYEIKAYNANNQLISGTQYCFSASTYLVGDINGNGVVNNADYTILNNIVNGNYAPTTGTEIRGGDINGDGVINATDRTHLYNYLHGYQYSLADIQAG